MSSGVIVLIVLGLLAAGSWLSWYVGGMQDEIDKHYIDRDES